MDPSVPPQMMDASNPYSYGVTLLQLLITVLTLFGTVWVGVYAAWREHRNRKWAIEDEVKRKLEAEEASKKLEVKIETKIAKEAETTNAKIDENTELSKKAFTEANGLNAKIVRLQRQIFDASKSGRLTPEEVKLLRARLAAEGEPPPRQAGEESNDSSDINFLPKEISNKPKTPPKEPPKDPPNGDKSK